MDMAFLAVLIVMFLTLNITVAYFSVVGGLKEISVGQKSGERGIMYLLRLIAEVNVAGLYGWKKLGEVSAAVLRWLLTPKNCKGVDE